MSLAEESCPALAFTLWNEREALSRALSGLWVSGFLTKLFSLQEKEPISFTRFESKTQ